MKIIKSQRGAMFGLDARIALAIFGTLSVVAGVTIIAIIAETRSASVATEMDNFEKGYIHYRLKTNADTNDINVLLGEYMQHTSDNHAKYGTWSLVYEDDTDLDGDWPGTVNTCDDGNSTEDCAVWLKLTEVPTAVTKQLEMDHDGRPVPGATDLTGVFRYTADGDSDGDHDVYRKLTRLILQN